MNETDFASYSDGNTPYRTGNIIDEFIQSLEHDSMMLFKWFSDESQHLAPYVVWVKSTIMTSTW